MDQLLAWPASFLFLKNHGVWGRAVVFAFFNFVPFPTFDIMRRSGWSCLHRNVQQYEVLGLDVAILFLCLFLSLSESYESVLCFGGIASQSNERDG
jgi:hypothetical protein